ELPDVAQAQGIDYGTRIDANGDVVSGWPAGGARFSQRTSPQADPQLWPDGTGGAIAEWDEIDPDTTRAYAQRFSASVQELWLADGISLPRSATSTVVPDGVGGLIVAWSPLGEFSETNILAQRYDPDGLPLWVDGGVSVCSAPEAQNSPVAAPDGAG